MKTDASRHTQEAVFVVWQKQMDETTYSIAIHHAQVYHLSNPLQVAEGIADDIQMFVLLIGLPPHLQPVILYMTQYSWSDPEASHVQVHKWSPTAHVSLYCVSYTADMNPIRPA